MHTIIEIKEEFLLDDLERTKITIRYLTWDENQKCEEIKEVLILTHKEQDEMVAGLKKLYQKLKRFE